MPTHWMWKETKANRKDRDTHMPSDHWEGCGWHPTSCQCFGSFLHLQANSITFSLVPSVTDDRTESEQHRICYQMNDRVLGGGEPKGLDGVGKKEIGRLQLLN